MVSNQGGRDGVVALGGSNPEGMGGTYPVEREREREREREKKFKKETKF